MSASLEQTADERNAPRTGRSTPQTSEFRQLSARLSWMARVTWTVQGRWTSGPSLAAAVEEQAEHGRLTWLLGGRRCGTDSH